MKDKCNDCGKEFDVADDYKGPLFHICAECEVDWYSK